MNWGAILAWTSVVICVGACAGYVYVQDWRRALYYFFAACITAVVNWP